MITEELQNRLTRLVTFYEHDREICTSSEWNDVFYWILVRITHCLREGYAPPGNRSKDRC